MDARKRLIHCYKSLNTVMLEHIFSNKSFSVMRTFFTLFKDENMWAVMTVTSN